MKETDQVWMTHPGIDGVAGPVPKSAFERTWKAKGWKLAEDPRTAKPPTTATSKTEKG